MACGILIVDDDPDIRLLVRFLMKAANGGLVLSEASNGVEALESIDDLDPQVVVLDHMMPEMTGLEVAKAIKEKRPGQAMIMCSAYLTAEIRAKAVEVGVKACLSKQEIDRLPELARSVGGC